MMELNSLTVLSIALLFFVIYLLIIKYVYNVIVAKPYLKDSKGWKIGEQFFKNTPIIPTYDLYDEKKENGPTILKEITNLQQVITCQPSLTSFSTENLSHSNHKLKPFPIMPSSQKHIENLKRQRAFRKRREDYVRSLETKAENFELLYADTQKNIKMLREKLVLLERRLAKAQRNHNDKCNTPVCQIEGQNIGVPSVISYGPSTPILIDNHDEENNDTT
ncbi:hypothetical protein C1645_200517 [Glomus cerebriforme]|uniref:BZIP domain-containing protein n=1 Tax=Glomus cerebriforme TaxID=658196 RepID=A0A397SZI6_9GLOM|nr:hypothetical protein C1645_200517 [Glomus cerebriforme]